jgi:hypothetical protein
MSYITAEVWAAKISNQLRLIEQNCTDDELFCVGYLIPQVELLEVEFVAQKAESQDWDARFKDYVRANMQLDKLLQEDVARIEAIMSSL